MCYHKTLPNTQTMSKNQAVLSHDPSQYPSSMENGVAGLTPWQTGQRWGGGGAGVGRHRGGPDPTGDRAAPRQGGIEADGGSDGAALGRAQPQVDRAAPGRGGAGADGVAMGQRRDDAGQAKTRAWGHSTSVSQSPRSRASRRRLW
jgi:hypothetical protein